MLLSKHKWLVTVNWKLLYGWANDFNEYIVFFDRFLNYIPFLESKKVQFRFMGVKGLKQSLK